MHRYGPKGTTPRLLKGDSMASFDRLEVLPFDRCGTLIDWERGILDALRPMLQAKSIGVGDEVLLEAYADLEVRAEAGE